jgi:ABC-type anion transport system duplicated permease subunit
MTKKIIIAAVIAYAIGCLLGPPDRISQIVFGLMAAVVCAVPLLILARFPFVKTASKPVHTLVCVLVCMIAVLSLFCYTLVLRITSNHERLQAPPVASSQP